MRNPLYARDYEALWSPVIRPMAEVVLGHLPIGSAQRILDVGTGCGALVPALRAAAPQSAIVGIDASIEMARLARQRGVPSAVMDAASLGFRPGSFDAALAAFMLFILEEPARALGGIHRALRPRGWLATVTWGEDRFAPGEEVWEQELRAAGAPARTEHPSSHRVNTPAKMEALCLACGFDEPRAWASTLEHRWHPEDLLRLKTAPGFADRLFDLPPPSRRSVVERTRRRFESLGPADFVWSAEVVYCVAQVRPPIAR